MHFLRQSTAVVIKLGPFVDATDGSTVETALSITQADVRLAKGSGTMAQKNDATTATHDALGWYNFTFNTTDTNTLNHLTIIVTEAGALPLWEDCFVLPANVYDSLFSSDRLDVNIAEIDGDTTAAINQKRAAQAVHVGVITGAVTTTTLIDAGLTQTTTDHWKGRVLVFVTGNLTKQMTDITAFTPATDQLTFTALTAAPAVGDIYVIL